MMQKVLSKLKFTLDVNLIVVNSMQFTNNLFSYTHFHSNRSLYEELKEATTINPSHSGEFTTTEFGAFEDENTSTNEVKMGSFEDETSIEKRFRIDENEFRTNNTKEERRILTEGIMDEESFKYDQKTSKLVKVEDSNETTEIPLSSTTTSTKPIVTSAKKGKHLDLLQSESDNVNMTIPNNAEVWTLAGMKNVVPKSYNTHHDESTENGNHETKMTSNAKNLLDWMEIARMTDLRNSHSNENETFSSERIMTTAESDLSTSTIKMNSDETTTEFFKESRTINSEESSTEELLLPKNGKGISQLTTINTESPETTENSIELINSTKQRDEDLLTISSALSGTTQTSPSPTSTSTLPKTTSTTSKKVTTTTQTLTTTTTANSREEILSTIPSRSTSTSTRKTTTNKPFIVSDEDEILAASSSNPGVFRVTTTYGSTVIIDEKDADKYHTFHEVTPTTDSIDITTEQQRINKNEEGTDSSGLGIISAVISVILVLSLGALAYVSKHRIFQHQISEAN
jgi:trimeric autotransporter adhesin